MRIIHTTLVLLGVTMTQACAEQDRPASAEAAAVAVPSPAAATITPEDMRKRIGILASDAMRGRATPSPGLDSAVAYVASEFKRLGLQPAGDSGTFVQHYMIGRSRAPNVVAILPGSDASLRNTYIVLSAHIDHIGVSQPIEGDSINNGADDDASGTSAVMEVAEAFASGAERPRRSIIFLAVSGEERGLLGSAYFAEHPPVPIGSIVANINIDMISRNARDTIVAIGQEYSSLGPLSEKLARRHTDIGLAVTKDPWPQERLFFRSDHFNFARKEIPSIFFFAGLHQDYHAPNDEVERVDAEKAARVARLAFYLSRELANSAETPVWTESGLKEVRRLTRD